MRSFSPIQICLKESQRKQLSVGAGTDSRDFIACTTLSFVNNQLFFRAWTEESQGKKISYSHWKTSCSSELLIEHLEHPSPRQLTAAFEISSRINISWLGRWSKLRHRVVVPARQATWAGGPCSTTTLCRSWLSLYPPVTVLWIRLQQFIRTCDRLDISVRL